MNNSYLNDILDKIKISPADSEGYNVEEVLRVAITRTALAMGKSIYTRSRSGFMNIPKEEFVKEFGLMHSVVLGDNYFIFSSNDTLLTISGDSESEMDLNLFTILPDDVDIFKRVCDSALDKTKLNTVFALAQSHGGVHLTALGKVNEPLIRGNYKSEVVEGFDFIVEDFQAADPHGRLVIINGPPGTGKTFLIKGLVSELKDSTIVIIPPDMVSQIDGPMLIPTLISHKKYNASSIVLLIEDADACLAPRASDNISAIRSLLNCADGLLGSLLDIRVVATTNQKKVDFDDALVRPGRLSRFITIDELDTEKANQVYFRLTGFDVKKYTVPTILAQVYIDADIDTGGKIKGAVKKVASKKYKGTKDRILGFR